MQRRPRTRRTRRARTRRCRRGATVGSCRRRSRCPRIRRAAPRTGRCRTAARATRRGSWGLPGDASESPSSDCASLVSAHRRCGASRPNPCAQHARPLAEPIGRSGCSAAERLVVWLSLHEMRGAQIHVGRGGRLRTAMSSRRAPPFPPPGRRDRSVTERERQRSSQEEQDEQPSLSARPSVRFSRTH